MTLQLNTEETIGKRNKWLDYFFFSNWFYGVCAVALSVEAALQQRVPMNSVIYFVLVFFATVLYYNYPYTRKGIPRCNNPRTNWYSENYRLMHNTQLIITGIVIILLCILGLKHRGELLKMDAWQWLVFLVFPVVAALYYGSNILPGRYNLRRTGWLKPFVIGFTWAGLVTIYPVLFYDVVNGISYDLTLQGFLLFLKNMMFVAVLCIMFDIKDYRPDYISRLRTFVVRMGLRKTIFYILLPLTITGLISFILYASTHQFPYGRVFMNVIPFILLLVVAWSLRRRRSPLYYLAVVDGLMLIKAICGSIAILCF